ncbi:uracil phosphoribosyltransferase [Penicillium brasilianum]|uniref:uracil phosphoribosyltransferase n=1 Tax=Penicillium brasilianum TaxID=104259 RepID=A0A1S9RIN9_PENBI|nr:uracil phosphoribosyltransferase [Penicillium brasilianum]
MSLPPNVHISAHPCLQAKLSQLRSQSTTPRETRALVEEIASILGVEAFAQGLTLTKTGTDRTPLGVEYETSTIEPADLALVPILRSGLGMIDASPSLPRIAITSLLPTAVPIYHLGLFREPVGLQPVEYYNNLPFHKSALSPASPASTDPTTNTAASTLAILLDPVIATGATADAAIQTLRDWGVQRVIMISVLASVEGVKRVAGSWEGVQIWVGAVDEKVNEKGMIVPGVGDIGDRLFVALGK